MVQIRIYMELQEGGVVRHAPCSKMETVEPTLAPGTTPGPPQIPAQSVLGDRAGETHVRARLTIALLCAQHSHFETPT